MHSDVLTLIHEYKREMEFLEETIRFVNEKYDDLLDVHFDTLCQVEFFTGVLEVELTNAHFFVFEGRCPRCSPRDSGHWTYTDNSPLSIGTLLEFMRHLKTINFLCEHERIDSVQTCHFLCLIKLKNVTGS